MSDFLFRGSLADLDPEIYDLTQIEAERQVRKLIMIASESTAPMAVHEALGSAFQNIYAEGYPDEETRWMSDEEILDYPARLAHYRYIRIAQTPNGSSDPPEVDSIEILP
jgi:glycine hydroxymethyltransferase